MQKSFVDSTVENGVTYYYAVTAYDKGFVTTNIEGQVLGIPPSETTSIIIVDANGNVKTDVNTAVVIPRAPAAGYVPPKLENYIASGPGTGSVNVTILDPDSLNGGHSFKLSFQDSSPFHNNPDPFYQLLDLTSVDTVVPL